MIVAVAPEIASCIESLHSSKRYCEKLYPPTENC